MANPQKENGYTAIANEVLEKLIIFPFPDKTGVPIRLIMYVIRKTWGYQKKVDVISLTQFQKGIKSNRPSVVHWLDYLVKAKILVKGRELTRVGIEYSFNKDWEQWNWLVKASELVSVRKVSSMLALTDTSMLALTHKRNKESNTKESSEQSSQIVQVIDSFKEVNPSFGKWYGNKTQRAAIERMIKIHGCGKILKVISILPKTNKMTWITTITTPVQLEDKWATLESQLIKEKHRSMVSRKAGAGIEI